eukprot:5584891-Pleurochrysis_carterae.AAC.1
MLFSEFHKRTRKVKPHTARTFHTVRGALVLNEQKRWCELCAWAHGKDCQRLVAYRAEEAKRKQELLARSKRESAPTRVQQQATKPEYNVSVEMEKQVKSAGFQEGDTCASLRTHANITHMCSWIAWSWNAGTGGCGPRGLRGDSQRSRRSKGEVAGGAECGQDADGVLGLSPTSGELPVFQAKVQILPVQPPQQRYPHRPQGHGIGGREERQDAVVAAGWQRRPGRWSGPQPRKGRWRYTQRRHAGKVDRKANFNTGWSRNGKVRGEWEGTKANGLGKRAAAQTTEQLSKQIDTSDDDATPSTKDMMSVVQYTTHHVGKTLHTCDVTHEEAGRIACGIECAIQAVTTRRTIQNNACLERVVEYKKETNERQTKGKKGTTRKPTTETYVAIRYAIRTSRKQSMDREEAHMGRMDGNKTQTVILIMYVGVTLITWLTRMGKERAELEQEKHKKKTWGEKVSSRTARKIPQRRIIQQRIRRWNKTRKVKDKDRKKYRHKVRSSLQWMRGKTEAMEANIREGGNRTKKMRKENVKRKGGAGGKGRARMVETSNVEEELMRDIGVPQYTWGDGSCWLWAVAGALQKLERKGIPTEKDRQLEREWRAAIQDVVKTHGIPITDEDLQGMGEGVQYTHGRLTRGGTWGGGTEHQALAILLKVNIVIWDRRYIGRVGEHHRQLYVCTPHGSTYLRNVGQTLELIRQSEFESIHVLYDAVAKHYEYFANNDAGEGIADGPGSEVQTSETGKRKDVREGEHAGVIMTETPRNKTAGDGETIMGNRTGKTNTKEGKELQRSEVLLGTLNISGITFGYRGKYMKTEEELLKIRPGDKLREVTEMMKTQG